MSSDTVPRPPGFAQLLSIENKQDFHLWDALVDSAPSPDVYYRPGYLRAYQASGQGLAVALLIEIEGLRVLLPLLLRPLSDLGFASEAEGFDAATPYGYGGLLLLEGRQDPQAEQVRALLRTLRDWCYERKVISVLLRLHPLLQQQTWLSLAVDCENRIHSFGPTTALDLSRWNCSTDCVATLHKGRRSDLTFARRSLHVTSALELGTVVEDLGRFYELYERRMDQLGAADFYHFPPAYYTVLAEGLGSRLDVIMAWMGERPVGAALFIADRTLAHYHLSACNDTGRAQKATTLILNAAADRARRRGCKYLHLGGGATGSDKLFDFKKSFGGEVFEYSFFSLICDRERYDDLLQRRLVALPFQPFRPNFFPEYRA